MDSDFLSYLSSMFGGGAAGTGVGGISAMMGKGGEQVRPQVDAGYGPSPGPMQGPMPQQTNPLGTTQSPSVGQPGGAAAPDKPPVNPLQMQLLSKLIAGGGNSVQPKPSQVAPLQNGDAAPSGGAMDGFDTSQQGQQPQRQYRQQGGNQNLRASLAEKQKPVQPMQGGSAY